MPELSTPQSAFLDQLTRKKMVDWATEFIINPDLEIPEDLFVSDPCLSFALGKGWFTKRLPRRLTAGGWGIATSFLKR